MIEHLRIKNFKAWKDSGDIRHHWSRGPMLENALARGKEAGRWGAA